MLKFGFIAISLLAIANALSSQKPAIDTNALNSWQVITSARLSDNGMYVCYTIKNTPAGSNTLVLKPTEETWEMRVIGVSAYPNVLFSNNSRMLFFNKDDSLGIIDIDNRVVSYQLNVLSFRLLQIDSTGWIACMMDNPKKRLLVKDLLSGKTTLVDDVEDFTIMRNHDLIVKQRITHGNSSSTVIKRVDLAARYEHILWKGVDAGNLVVDELKEKMCFGGYEDDSTIMLHYYEIGEEKVLTLGDGKARGLEDNVGIKISSIQNFSHDCQNIFLNIFDNNTQSAKSGMAAVDVWNYKDASLQSYQLKNRKKAFAALLNIKTRVLTRLEYENEDIVTTAAKLVLIRHAKGDINERNWNKEAVASCYLVYGETGKRIRIADNYYTEDAWTYKLSPEGKFVLFWDKKSRDYFSFETNTGITRNITNGKLQLSFVYNEDEDIQGSNVLTSVENWLSKDSAAIVYFQNDLWQLDPNGLKIPINLTNGYGRRNNIVFRLATDNFVPVKIFSGQEVVVNAFDRDSKNNGYFNITIGKNSDPKVLSMGPYFYVAKIGPVLWGWGLPSIKAKYSNVFLVRRESVSESTNLFVTNDFKSFKQLSAIRPEKNVKWFTSELIRWKAKDGSELQGVLYKPEDFDARKKYPVIITYYETLSDFKNMFRVPELVTDRLDIPWFVSRGYVVFTPDISYHKGEIGQSVLNSILPAVKYLNTFPWFDEKHVGIQGHSFGGFETNYLVANTNLFAAAMSASGISDLISNYGSVWDMGGSRQGWTESGQGRMYATLWEQPEIYIKNSPIFKATKVSTPLLMMNNKNDGAVDFAQGVEFFTALRRLNKKAWMLQYDGESHSVFNSKNKLDLTIRITQFFDHYLKNGPAPLWMTEGIPYKLKGIESRYELDPQGTCNTPQGEHCLICESWNAQYKRTPEMFRNEIKHWVLDNDIAEELERKQNERRREFDKEGEVRTKEVLKMLAK